MEFLYFTIIDLSLFFVSLEFERLTKMEIWLPIKDFPNYEVSSEGRVRNKHGRVLRPGTNNLGYPVVTLSDGHRRCTKTVHRLVALTFYDTDGTGLVVDHIDGDKQHNHISNLEFCSSGENNARAYKTGLRQPARQHDHPTCKKVRVVETGKVYKSIAECARSIGANKRHITDCLHGRLKRHHGFHYEYAD